MKKKFTKIASTILLVALVLVLGWNYIHNRELRNICIRHAEYSPDDKAWTWGGKFYQTRDQATEACIPEFRRLGW